MANKKTLFLHHSWPIPPHSMANNAALAPPQKTNSSGGNHAVPRSDPPAACPRGSRGALRRDRHFGGCGGGALSAPNPQPLDRAGRGGEATDRRPRLNEAHASTRPAVTPRREACGSGAIRPRVADL